MKEIKIHIDITAVLRAVFYIAGVLACNILYLPEGASPRRRYFRIALRAPGARVLYDFTARMHEDDIVYIHQRAQQAGIALKTKYSPLVDIMTEPQKDFLTTVKFGLPVASSVLCIVGTLANTISLIYFVQKKNKTNGDKLLMLLNSVDLLLCACAAVDTICLSLYLQSGYDGRYAYAFITFLVPYILLVDGTAYVTCILSVTRAIGIARPFYQIQGKLLLIVGIIVFIVTELIQVILLLKSGGIPGSSVRIAISLLVLLIVLCAMVVAVYKLTKKDIEAAERLSQNNKKATFTVVILSGLFFVFNSVFLGLTVNLLFNHGNLNKDNQALILTYIGLFIAVPLNSSINPIIYLVRKRDMREFFVQNFGKICQTAQPVQPQVTSQEIVL